MWQPHYPTAYIPAYIAIATYCLLTHCLLSAKRDPSIRKRSSENLEIKFSDDLFIFQTQSTFSPLQQFFRQGEVGFGAFGVGIVGERGHAVAGGFGEADVAGDDGLEHQVAEMLEKLFADFDDEAAAAVVEGADDAGDVEARVDCLTDFAHGGDEVGDAFEGIVFAQHGDDDAVGGDESVEREQGQRRGAVDEDEVVVVFDGLQGVFEADFAGDFLHQLDFGTGKRAVGAEYVVAAVPAADDGGFDVGIAQYDLVHAFFEAGFVYAAACGGVALRVEVDDEDAFAFGGERCREVDGGGGFADAAFLVGDGEDLCAHVFAAVGWINGGILTFFA